MRSRCDAKSQSHLFLCPTKIMSNHIVSALINSTRVSRGPYRLSRRSVSGSNVQIKLNHFLNTGEIIKRTPAQTHRRNSKAIQKANGAYSGQKIISILQSRYDGKLQNAAGGMINVNKLTTKDINVASEKSLEIFQALVGTKKIDRKPIDQKLLLTLLGTNAMQLKDPFLVTRDVLKLLERDNDTVRAETLARMAGSRGGVVAMNAILQWHFDHGDIKGGLKCFNDRKKWGIPSTSYTYTILFDGISRASSWGGVSAEACQKYLTLFDTFREKAAELRESGKTDLKCTVEHFNACLGIFVRSFVNDQEFAWSFFDKLLPDPKSTLPAIIPTCQTFTILLNGVKRKAQADSDKISQNSGLTRKEKIEKLDEIRQNLAYTADQILGKVLTSATPPVPPTKEEAEHNPEVLTDYRQKSRRLLVDVDEAFVSVYVSCFINTFLYIQSLGNTNLDSISYGLTALKVWCPEVENIIRFANGNVSSEISYINNPQVDSTKINPLVTFPPSLLSRNKNRALFSGKKKPLVDLSRHTGAEVRTMFLHNQYLSSKGKFGKKASADFIRYFNGKKQPLNKFILMLVLDGLLKLGKFQEFYLAVWYMLSKWGAVKVDNKELLERYRNGGVQKGLLPLVLPESTKSSGNIITECVDIMMVENFIFKISENFPYQQESFAGRLVTELVQAVVTVNNKDLQIRPKTVDAVFSVLTSDIHHFNDSNYNRMIVASKKRNVRDNTPKKSLLDKQLLSFMPTLNAFMDTLLLHSRNNGKKSLPNYTIDSYNRIIERIYRSTWFPQNSTEFVNIHKLIIRSGVSFFAPKAIRDPRLKLTYSEIEPSIKYVLDSLRVRDDLSKEDVQLMLALRSIMGLVSIDTDATSKMSHLAKKVRSLIPLTIDSVNSTQ
ncbi:hypothetical protein PGUG_03556 [Meyerozyma guilliermondii ATCC 6260]|uniref:Mitochondrial 15S rRNA processing factor CCM1 n=1 Tax=Meyerozyma guilliermondii (strain ATCC 6260 / CBS 566 / DSM 6381 / JCM 1539 / NBRC 10279 / NRRL Y-324) TaxID=294746 RepID=A5DJV5_PICGU|nr:uncharacterized protein PGUG_03556 [Meyerozyma guilliermondii ATCC 6260]EDK39458.2 hypothetical protein PGUG_03556 [Meyerozyma guilliermondii ATCC 6260]